MITENLKWNDPSLWKGVSVGICKECDFKHVLRDGVCYSCEQHKIDKGYELYKMENKESIDNQTA